MLNLFTDVGYVTAGCERMNVHLKKINIIDIK